MRNLMILILLCIVLQSCSSIASIFLNSKLKDAKVETNESVKAFQTKYKFDTTNSYVIIADTSNGLEWMTKSLGGDYEIYNSKGQQLIYNGSPRCGGGVFYIFSTGQIDSFIVDTSFPPLQKVMTNVKKYNDDKMNFNQLPKADYYITTFWSKFAGGKFGYKQGVKYYEEDIKNDTVANRKVHFIKINVDMQESWGVDPKGIAKVKARVKKREVFLTIDPLPIKH